MNSARRKILKMVYEGKVSVDEAEDLLETLTPSPAVPPSLPLPEFIGDSEWAQNFRKTLDRLAQSQVPVLIQAEDGTGKTIAAHVIHYKSRRATGPFTHFDCDASPETADSELFGFEEGAFQPRKGLLDLADGGTLLMEAPESMPIDTQRRLLAFLHDGFFTRIGGAKPIYADVRLVAITNRPVEELVDSGRLLIDLYRMVVFLQIPPLRERREDILSLVRHGIAHQADRPLKLSDEATRLLRESDLGIDNARRLGRIVTNAVMLCDGDEIQPEHLTELTAGNDGT